VDVAYNVAAGGHAALVGLGLGDVDDVVEQVCFAVLPTEVLDISVTGSLTWWRDAWTDPADNVIVVGQMRLAVLAPVDLG
jgi:hypothetical protein